MHCGRDTLSSGLQTGDLVAEANQTSRTTPFVAWPTSTLMNHAMHDDVVSRVFAVDVAGAAEHGGPASAAAAHADECFLCNQSHCRLLHEGRR